MKIRQHVPNKQKTVPNLFIPETYSCRSELSALFLFSKTDFWLWAVWMLLFCPVLWMFLCNALILQILCQYNLQINDSWLICILMFSYFTCSPFFCPLLLHPAPCSLNPSTSPETTISFKLMVFEVTTSSGWEPCLPRALRTSRQQNCRLRQFLRCWKQKLQMDWQKPRRTREQLRGDFFLVTRKRGSSVTALKIPLNSHLDSLYICLHSAV